MKEPFMRELNIPVKNALTRQQQKEALVNITADYMKTISFLVKNVITQQVL